MAIDVGKVCSPERASPVMKRAHQKAHLRIWFILGPPLLGIIYFAVNLRPDTPVNDILPANLSTEAE